MQAIAFDKTGTLTKGKPEVTDFIVQKGIYDEDILRTAASIESHSTHPLANAIVKYAKEKLEDDFIQLESIEDVAGWGVKAIIDQEEWKIGKAGFVREEEAEQFAEQSAKRLAGEGKTVVFVQKAGS